MDNERLVRNWYRTLIEQSRTKLGRPLTDKEERFITAHGGFIALEARGESVASLAPLELERYLNSN